jgi:GntR family transcriptional regulator/MocR family aminotransferase
VDNDGLVVASLASGTKAARLTYVTPSHQYPLGVAMNVARRLELLEWARRERRWIIEDDYDSEYRFASRPLGALQGMGPKSQVIYIDTFSKVLFPALRIGYLVVPQNLIERFVAHRHSLDLFSPTLYQLALAVLLSEGHFARHIRRMREVYRKRRNVLVDEIERCLNGLLTIVNADAGMHLTALLAPGIDDRVIVERAGLNGISAIALSTCYAGIPVQSGLVLGFGGSSENTLVEAVKALALIIEDVRGA